MQEPDGFRVLAFDRGEVRRAASEVEAPRVPPPLVKELARAQRGETHWPLYLWGSPGGGKTFGALYAVRRSFRGFWIDAAKWAKYRIEEDYLAGQVIEQMGVAEGSQAGHLVHGLVVIDEIGLRAQATDWQLESLLVLLNARRGLPLIVTGNLAPDAVTRVYDGRVSDRLCNAGTVLNLAGASQRDWRPKGAK